VAEARLTPTAAPTAAATAPQSQAPVEALPAATIHPLATALAAPAEIAGGSEFEVT
jgi:hypothetical protein